MAMGYKFRNWNEKDYEKLIDMYNEGTKQTDIARHFQVSPMTIRKRLKELGLII